LQEIDNPRSRVSRRRLADNIASLYVLQGLNYVIPMAVLPYLVRVLGMDMYGLFAFAQSFAQYFTILTDYGFNYSATRALAQQESDSMAASRLFSSVFALKLLFGFLGGLLLVAIVALVPRFHDEAAYFYVGYLAVVGNVLFPVWYYQGIQQMRYISIVSGAARLLAAAALFVFVHHPQDMILALAIQSSGMLLSGIAGIIIVLLHFRVRLVWPTLPDMRLALAEGWHLFVSTAAISLYTNTNVFLVGMLAGNVEAGYFSAAEKLVRAMNGLIGPVSQAVFPHVSTLVKESPAAALGFARKMLGYMLPITLVPSLAILLLAGPIAHICFGHGGGGSIPVMRWIAMLPVIIAVSNVLGVQIMIPFGLDKQFSRILVFVGILNVLLAIPLDKFYGAEGAGACVLTAELLVTLAMVISLERRGLSVFRSGKTA
jgi:PST family polysaccharide transporter